MVEANLHQLPLIVNILGFMKLASEVKWCKAVLLFVCRSGS